MSCLRKAFAVATSLIVLSMAWGPGEATAQIAKTLGSNPLVLEDSGSGHQHGYEVAPPDPSTLGGEFSLVDQHGVPVTDRSLTGRWTLVYFGYAGCAETCPTALRTLAAIVDRMAADGKDVQPIFIDFSVVYSRMHNKHASHMPKIDPIAFAREIHPRLLVLSGTRKNMFGALRHYRVRQEHSPLAYGRKDTGMRIDHTTWIYLVDPKGKVVAYYYHDLTPDALASDIAQKLKS